MYGNGDEKDIKFLELMQWSVMSTMSLIFQPQPGSISKGSFVFNQCTLHPAVCSANKIKNSLSKSPLHRIDYGASCFRLTYVMKENFSLSSVLTSSQTDSSILGKNVSPSYSPFTRVSSILSANFIPSSYTR